MEVILLLIFASCIMEIVDSSIGMMYGTLLSPILIIFGFDPIYVIPAILVSQAVGGLSGTIVHHKVGNANFNGMTKDTRIVLAMVVPGALAVFLGASVSYLLPKLMVKAYIAALVMSMSILCIAPINYKFAMWKHYIIGLIAAFNKALTGGGFGPVTSTGGIMGGLQAKVSVATTTYAELGICSLAYLSYLIITKSFGDVRLTVTLCIGAFIGGLIGPYISTKMNHEMFRHCIGIVGIMSASWLIYRIM